ncbi:MAG: class I SAM-dependent methyltransferase [Phycisphaerales bacterium]|nr:class I SAM-dependent methyltransferase [Phycisphaerales bacterium]
MAMKPPAKYSRPARQTLHWLLHNDWLQHPQEATGEAQYLLCHAERLDQSLRRLPKPRSNKRCLVVGSWGLEVPYLKGKLGWEEITCICAPLSQPGEVQKARRDHPNGSESYTFDLIEHDIEGGEWPFDSETFGLVVFWGCFEHLRHDPEFALYEINRVCEPGAVITLVTDNAISFHATHSILRGSPMPMRLHHPTPEGHWRLYTPPEIGELLEGTGWRVDLLTSIVEDAPVYWKWWKRRLFKKLVADYRRGFGLREPYWNGFVLAHATKVAAPTRAYPKWLYKDPKIHQLKVEMLERVYRPPNMMSA